MNKSLLPAGSSKLERHLSLTFADISHIPVPLNYLWSAEYCPTAILPWLAWTVSVDEWQEDWSEENKRNAIRQSIYIHQHKGTLASIRRVLTASGFGDAEILENLNAKQYDGQVTYNGDYFYGATETHWASYRVYLKRPISVEQADTVRKLLSDTAPARCHLIGLHFETANLYNQTLTYNGSYTYGVA